MRAHNVDNGQLFRMILSQIALRDALAQLNASGRKFESLRATDQFNAALFPLVHQADSSAILIGEMIEKKIKVRRVSDDR